MEYTLIKQVRKEDALRESFMALAREVFGLSFNGWYQNGYWTEHYIPYVLAKGRQVIANVSVNVMDMTWQGAPRRDIQLGTVMTHPDYRRQGLCRRLMKAVLEDWQGRCYGIYLFANPSVLDFYPKFGFQAAAEHQFTLPVSPGEGGFVRLDMHTGAGRETLKRCFEKGNPYAAFSMARNYGLLMFYCGGALKNNVYYSKRLDTACIAEQEGPLLLCHDIFGGGTAPLEELLAALAAPGTEKAALGFTPSEPGEGGFSLVDEDGAFFVWPDDSRFFQGQKGMFPTLSHA